MPEPGLRRVWRPPFPLDVRLTLSDLRHGPLDPCHRLDGAGGVWRCSLLPSGAVSYRVAQPSPTQVTVDAWGAGAAELVDGLPDLLGAHDRPETFAPEQPELAEAHRRRIGFRVPRTGRVLEALVPAIVEQRVIGIDAHASWRWLVSRHGAPAPGPAPSGMRLPPTPEAWMAIPSWDWHHAGVDVHRRRAAQAAAAAAGALERSAAQTPVDLASVYRRLRSLPGIGVWTAAQVGHRALGDADALPLGDYHLTDLVGFGLLGHPLTEEEVEAYCERWRPHRYRAIRLLELAPFPRRPRRAPRRPLHSWRRR
ncbi:MAG: DNA-3-methyladenine glycosylase 2 family protein [Candidatus Dormiibacterota bacterium]